MDGWMEIQWLKVTIHTKIQYLSQLRTRQMPFSFNTGDLNSSIYDIDRQ
jgi:hypothetical protein